MNNIEEIKRDALMDAIMEATRFVTKAEIAIKDIQSNRSFVSKAHAAAKRASMDLTNALVFVRKSPHENR